MRDIIWTLIFVWLAWQVVNIFRASNARRESDNLRRPQQPPPQAPSDRKKKLDTEGEYVDYEEVK